MSETALRIDPTELLKPAAYHRLAREIAAQEGPKQAVHLLSTFSAQFLQPLLLVESYRAGLRLDVTVGPFGQLEQALHDEASPLGREEARAVVLLIRPEDIEPELYQSTRACAVSDRLADLHARLVALAEQIRCRSRATILVANAAPPVSRDPGAPDALADALAAFNLALARSLADMSDCHVFDWAGAVTEFGSARWEDARLWYLARVPCSQEAAIFVSQRLARRLAAALLPRTKCVVVDLDDTLWGGVIGDDGPEGIHLGGDYPGNVFKDFQLQLKELTRKGILLAIASKNDEATVKAAFERHPEMVLRWSDFAAHRINWGPKAESIREIARALNIGIDSLVLLDDNPVECAAVERAVPGAQVYCLGRDPLRFRSALAGIASLDRPVVTREDQSRGEMYQQAKQRLEQEQRHQSREEFLASLEMKAQVASCDAVALPRVAQLIGKTNQFNLTCRRHSPDEVRALLASDDARVLTLRLSDHYGDLGLVCAGILRRSADDIRLWQIDTFLMSCRVMGRGVEDAFLAYLTECAAAAGATRLAGEYVPSPKNAIVRDFYTQRGFTDTGYRDGQTLRFYLGLSEGAVSWPEHIQRLG